MKEKTYKLVSEGKATVDGERLILRGLAQPGVQNLAFSILEDVAKFYDVAKSYDTALTHRDDFEGEVLSRWRPGDSFTSGEVREWINWKCELAVSHSVISPEPLRTPRLLTYNRFSA